MYARVYVCVCVCEMLWWCAEHIVRTSLVLVQQYLNTSMCLLFGLNVNAKVFRKYVLLTDFVGSKWKKCWLRSGG